MSRCGRGSQEGVEFKQTKSLEHPAYVTREKSDVSLEDPVMKLLNITR